jgi:hypothetical protein
MEISLIWYFGFASVSLVPITQGELVINNPDHILSFSILSITGRFGIRLSMMLLQIYLPAQGSLVDTWRPWL